jgi:acyl carrier protein
MAEETMLWLQETLADQLGADADEVRPEADVKDDLGADSLDITELVLDVEDKFAISIDLEDEEIESLKTVQQWHDYIEKAKQVSRA